MNPVRRITFCITDRLVGFTRGTKVRWYFPNPHHLELLTRVLGKKGWLGWTSPTRGYFAMLFFVPGGDVPPYRLEDALDESRKRHSPD